MTTTLKTKVGRATGSAEARRLRSEDHIPAIIYGHGMTPVSITVERRELRAALSGPAGVNTILELHVDDKKYPAIVKDLQRDPVKRTVSHIDFLLVNPDEKIRVHVPLHLSGEAKAVNQAGGRVDPAVDHLDLFTTPNQMPSEVRIDVTNLQPGQVIHLHEVALPAGCSAAGDPDMPVVVAAIGKGATGRP